MDAAVRHGGRIVGRMEGQTFVRLADPAKHMLRTPAAWAHDNALLDRLERAGCQAIRIDAKDGMGAWLAPLSVIRSKVNTMPPCSGTLPPLRPLDAPRGVTKISLA